MKVKSFVLLPFPSDEMTFPDIKITGSAGREGSVFSINYELTGDLSRIVLPADGKTPARVIGLWEATCLEFFLAPRGRADYWEFNLSPAGDWDVFHLDAYREGFRQEPSIQSLPFDFYSGPDALSLFLKCDLGGIIAAETSIDAAISAVIKTVDGKITCWALAHPADKPDFHHRGSFVLGL